MTNMDFGASLTVLLSRYAAVRGHTRALVAPLSAEDCGAQSMPDASPAKWHLAHTTWFFETFVLEPNEPGFAPFNPAFRVLFNSYYNGVGAKHPRPHRGCSPALYWMKCWPTVPTWTSAWGVCCPPCWTTQRCAR